MSKWHRSHRVSAYSSWSLCQHCALQSNSCIQKLIRWRPAETPITTTAHLVMPKTTFRIVKTCHDSCMRGGDWRRGGLGAAGENRARELLTCTSSCFLPGITEIAFKALSTLNVRRTERLPSLGTNSVTYLQRNLELLLNNEWEKQFT